MGVLAGLAVLRVHVLVVAPRGHELLGARVEAAARRRGWRLVGRACDADALVVCGAVGGALGEAVDALWHSVPAPRVRRRLLDAAAIAPVLDSIVRVLADDALQRASRPGPAERPPVAAARPPGVRPLVLGPLLPDWPPGLVVTGEVHRGVVLAAEGCLLGDVAPPVPDPLDPEAAALVLACGRAERVLRLAGWPARARRVAAVGDAVLAGSAPAAARRRLAGLATGVRRSAVLRTNLRGVGSGVDVRARLLALLADAGGAGGDAEPTAAALAAVLLGRRTADAAILLSLPAIGPHG